MVTPFQLGNRMIGPGYPCFLIAEAGVNHNGDLGMARRLVDVAAAAGADAVKFQTFRADRLATAEAPKAAYQAATTGKSESQVEMLRRLELSEEAHHELFEYARSKGVMFLSTPFDEGCADFLEQLGVPGFKAPSGEVTNWPFLEYLARKGRPILLSTGMATLGEVEGAVQALSRVGSIPFALFHCVSNYPAEPAQVNLRAMHTLQAAFGVPVGYSDHTLGIEVSLAAVALGACLVEKHFTLDRTLPGPDHRASLEPDELTRLVVGIRKVEAALGNGRKVPTPAEMETRTVARKSLVAARDLAVGTVLSPETLASKRPGSGLPPSFLGHLLGRRLKQAVKANTLLTLEMLE